jgi:hypothetical protein
LADAYTCHYSVEGSYASCSLKISACTFQQRAVAACQHATAVCRKFAVIRHGHVPRPTSGGAMSMVILLDQMNTKLSNRHEPCKHHVAVRLSSKKHSHSESIKQIE